MTDKEKFIVCPNFTNKPFLARVSLKIAVKQQVVQ